MQPSVRQPAALGLPTHLRSPSRHPTHCEEWRNQRMPPVRDAIGRPAGEPEPSLGTSGGASLPLGLYQWEVR
jgi:hypothetical protein